jgi:proline iminopeptidase
LIAEINGTEIYYNVKGKGKPIMMMHGGLGEDHKVFSPWLELLEDRYKVIYYDHRGNGRSGRPPHKTLMMKTLLEMLMNSGNTLE